MNAVGDVERGCGTRVVGGIYAESGMSPWGKPIGWFLCDPPRPLNGLRLPARGVTLFADEHGTYHIWDMIGGEHYPHVADWVEETRRFGVSRRLPRTLDFSKLTADSQLIACHARAYFRRWDVGLTGLQCVKDPALLNHYEDAGWPEPCAAMWWRHLDDRRLEDGTIQVPVECRVDGGLLDQGYTWVRRQMAAFSYHGWRLPKGVDVGFEPGVIGRFPLTGLSVVSGNGRTDTQDSERVAAAYDAARQSGVGVRRVSK